MRGLQWFRFLFKMVYVFLFCSLCTACPTHHNPLQFIILITSVKNTNYEAAHNMQFSPFDYFCFTLLKILNMFDMYRTCCMPRRFDDRSNI